MGGGSINQSGESSATGATFGFNFDFSGAGKPQPQPQAGLQNLIFGGTSSNNQDVNNEVNFGGKYVGSQINFNGNMGGGSVGQTGSSTATGSQWAFDFKCGPACKAAMGLPPVLILM